MPLISIILVLVVVGVLLWLVNTQLAPYMDGKILKILNIAVVVLVVLWLLGVVGALDTMRGIRIGP